MTNQCKSWKKWREVSKCLSNVFGMYHQDMLETSEKLLFQAEDQGKLTWNCKWTKRCAKEKQEELDECRRKRNDSWKGEKILNDWSYFCVNKQKCVVLQPSALGIKFLNHLMVVFVLWGSTQLFALPCSKNWHITYSFFSDVTSSKKTLKSPKKIGEK